WRERYYSPDPDSPAPRDYARVLTLDDALILDVNVSFGTDASDDGRLLPTMTADSRVYTGDNTHLLWEHEDVASDQSSSATMTDYQVQPWLLTDRLQKLAPALGTEIASSFLKAFSLAPSTSTSHSSHGAHGSHKMAPMGGGGGGLVSMSAFQHLSTAPAAGLAAAPPATAPAQSAPAISSSTAASVTVSSSAAALQALPGLAAPASVSTSAVSAAPPPAAPVSTSTAPAASPPR
ncbi:MAG TPA: hypothetical protein VH309_11735, partial [Elusimicrobiota bacterium]|nr:hypothetical protein [Elusimicrobiota bacterium]